MTTQLRLIAKGEAAQEQPRPLRGRARRRDDRRAVHWQGQWRLDSRTRAIGRAGVASAREALARAHGDDPDQPDQGDHLRRAS